MLIKIVVAKKLKTSESRLEPCHHAEASFMAGSLVKNPGGTVVKFGEKRHFCNCFCDFESVSMEIVRVGQESEKWAQLLHPFASNYLHSPFFGTKHL